MAKELLAYRLNTIHNLHYYMGLMAGIREAIREDRFEAFRETFVERPVEYPDPPSRKMKHLVELDETSM